MADIPLLRAQGPDAVFAYRQGTAITVRAFLRDTSNLAALLPSRQHVLNLCRDRYRFTVAFAAALLKRQITLLPPNYTPELVRQLKERHADVYCVVDTADDSPVAVETVHFADIQADGNPGLEFNAVPQVPAAQTAAYLFTSGSTGQPVPHRKTWGGLVKSGVAELERLQFDPDSAAAIVGTVPPQHMYGLESTVLIAMHGGLAIVAERPFYPADIRTALEALPRPRALVTTPVHLRALLCESTPLPALDRLICATAPLSPQLAAEGEARFRAPLQEIYGCTEAGQVATRRPVESVEWRTFQGLRLRQDEKGTWVAGGHVETEVLLNDVVELRDSERFLLHGRNADLVNIAGKRTSLAYLNCHLNSIEGVRDGVFIMPEDESPSAVPRLMAFAVAPGISAESILDALRQRIDAAFLPRPLTLVEALPRNSTGKLPRDAMTALVNELVANEP
ncbi:MAG: AMP-binding protein [Burkholderiales bacterium]